MTKPTRRQRLREETTLEILNTARAQMAAEGAAALSLRAIAREMGMTAPAIYRYFKGRDDLVTVLILQAYASLRTALKVAQQAHATQASWAQLLATGNAYRDWAINHAAEYVLIFGTPIPGYSAPESGISLEESSLGVLVEIIQEGLAKGELCAPEKHAALTQALSQFLGDAETKDAPALHIAVALWSHVHGFTSLELYNHLQPLFADPGEIFRLELRAKMDQFINKDGGK